MNLLVISHKETWRDPRSPSGYSTIGGFPFQMCAISNLFDTLTLMTPIQSTPIPSGAIPMTGHNLRFVPLAEPSGTGWHRKLAMLPWTLRHLPALWREICRADAVHTPVGGDIGTVGLLLTLTQRKPLFVRHCGTWGEPISLVDCLTQRGLEIIADGRNVVLATGGSNSPPSRRNPNLRWIFSTSLTRGELDATPTASAWSPPAPLRLVTVGRLTESKNVHSLLLALPLVREKIPALHLDLLGDGDARADLEGLVADLDLTSSVTFRGNVNHETVMQTLSSAHLFVFPSRREGFPKAVLEALACGLPVIATRTSVIPQLLQNGCGALLDDPTPEVIARKVLAVAADPARMQAMGRLARESAQGYTLEAWGETIGRHLSAAWGSLKAGEA